MLRVRERIYSRYTENKDHGSGPKTVAELSDREPTMLHVIHNFFPENKAAKILDLGCGHGTLVHYAKTEGYTQVAGIDVSDQQVALAHRLGITEVRKGDLMETLNNTPRGSLDVVISFDVIEHFSKDELLDFVDAVLLALKPGGRWIIHAPNGNSPFFGSVRYGDFTHELTFTPSSVWQLLNASGFSKIEFAECAPIVHGVKSFCRWVLWKCIRTLLTLVQVAETGELSLKGIHTRNFYSIGWK